MAAIGAVAVAEKQQNEKVIAQLKEEIWKLWKNDNLENRYWLGKKLEVLRSERAKPGHGTFLDDLAELDISRPTAYRLIHFYHKVCEGFDAKPVRLSQRDKDRQRKVWGSAFDELPGPPDDDDAQRAADEEQKRLQEYIKAEAAIVEKTKAANKGRPASYRVRLIFTDTQRDKFKKAFKRLTERTASRIIYKAVLDAARRS
jgi:hypothetical protein